METSDFSAAAAAQGEAASCVDRAPFNRYLADGAFEPLAAFFRAEGTERTYRNGEEFARQGVRNRTCGLLLAGAFRYVHLTADGERRIVGYAFAGEFVGDYISHCNGIPSWVSIEAMCDSRVTEVGTAVLETFYAADAAHERLGRRLAEHLLAEVYERLLERCAATPQERYERLLTRSPGVLDFIPLHELASYLGIRPETLSRIRRRIR